MASKPSKKKTSTDTNPKSMETIYGKGTEERRMAEKVLDRRGIAGSQKAAYVTEASRFADFMKYFKEGKENMIGGPAVNPNLGPKSKQQFEKEQKEKKSKKK